MNRLLDLPQLYLIDLFEQWLTVIEVCRFDSAIPMNCQQRTLFVGMLRSHDWHFSVFAPSLKLSVLHLHDWLHSRHLKVRSIGRGCPKLAYNLLKRKIPALADVVGGADRSTSRTSTSQSSTYSSPSSYSFTYSAESIKSLLGAVGIESSGSGVRWLDVGCGSSMLITIVKLCYIDAEVAGTDSPSIVATLKSIQSHCNYALYRSIPFEPINPTSTLFRKHVSSFEPTHLTCFSGLQEEEAILLTTARDNPTVTCLCLAERRGHNSRPDFSLYGFEQTHRLPVQVAGTRKRRYALVARRVLR